MKRLNNLSKVADILAALDCDFDEAVGQLKELLAEKEYLPLPVVYFSPFAEKNSKFGESSWFCQLKISAVKVGDFYLDKSSLWIDKVKDAVDARKKEDGCLWTLPSIEQLSTIRKNKDNIDYVLSKFGLYPLQKGWYRTDNPQVLYNLNTGQTGGYAEAKRFDICTRLVCSTK